ncbi:MAG: hypothetical protein PHP74_00475 [Candidatus Gracilibacteria bacterium]|nr:hypothetical protein [Candidatus Gracilibacteria bacterium]
MSEKKSKKSDNSEKAPKKIDEKNGESFEKDVEPDLANDSDEGTVSARKVVYAEIDDEITSIYDKIRNIKAVDVYVVLPKRAAIFQSIINLKILKRKAEKLGKSVYFVTNDKNGTYLATQVGITVYDRSAEGKPSLFSAESSDEKLRITPLKATVNSVEDDTPTRTNERKLSISELLRKNKGGEKTVDVTKLQTPKIKEKKDKPKFVIVAPNRHALIGLVVLSVFVLLTIIYIALPGATIYLTPSASVLEKSVNITLADFQRNKTELDTRPPQMIASYPLSITTKKSLKFVPTGKKFSERGSNASGKITIINTTNQEWPLIPQTRFQTDDGIVFRIPTGVTVPRATNQGAGKVQAFVVADPIDAYGAIVGERGNIEPTKFFLPGLKDDSRSKLYGESAENMSGGVTDYISYISKEDIEAARAKLRADLIKSSIEELRQAVAEKTKLVENSTVYTLLEGDKAVKTGEVKISIADDLEGKELKEFDISGEVSVSGVYYERDAMLEILKNELLLKKSPQKDLIRVNEDSTNYRIFEWDEDRGKIKMTANIKGIEQFAIDPNKENGQRLLNKIRDHIAGKDIESARLYMQNLPEINKVEIQSWPMWAPTIPKLHDNIKFEIRDAMNVK